MPKQKLNKQPPMPDMRPHFGWCWDLDADPQLVYDSRESCRIDALANNSLIPSWPVVVIPLPFMSARMKQRVLKFVKEQLPPNE